MPPFVSEHSHYSTIEVPNSVDVNSDAFLAGTVVNCRVVCDRTPSTDTRIFNTVTMKQET